MLKLLKKDWDSLVPIQQEDLDLLHSNGYPQRALELLQNKTSNAAAFGFKDPRVAKLLPFWKGVFAQSQLEVSYIITVRHPMSVGRSLANRNGFDFEKSYLLWLEHVINSLVGTLNERCVLIDYDFLMQSPKTELSKIAKSLGLQIDLQQLEQFEMEFLDKKLRHAIHDLNDLLAETAAPPLVREVYASILEVAAGKIKLDNAAFQTSLANWNDEFLRLKSLLIFTDNLLQINNNHKLQLSDLAQELNRRNQLIDSLTAQISESKAPITYLNEVMAERTLQYANLTREIHDLRTSTSWKITRPIRFIKSFMLNPKRASFEMAKYLFRKLPHSIQNRLETPAHGLIQKLRRIPHPPAVPLPGDLSWDEFQANILSQREKYKGVFIQEVIIDWNIPLFQRPQHLASALGRLGYLVIYRTLNNNLADTVQGFRNVAENVWLTNCEQTDQIAGAIRSFYSTSFYIDVRALITNIHPERFLVYEYIDHIDPMISGGDKNIQRLRDLKDFSLKGGADFVVASSRKLEAEAVAAVGKDKVVYVPNGVDVDHYRNSIHEATPISEELITFREKYSQIIGYFGAIAPWLWYDVINELAYQRPDLGFVFIGPDYQDCINKLPATSNTLYLGTIDYNVLPAYARKFDVCFIPFAPGEIAHTTSPLKLFEYFALEKPVVVTSFMDECIAFDEVFHGDSVQLLSDSIDRAIMVKDNVSYKAALAQLAEQNSWAERAKRFESIFYRKGELSISAIQKIITKSYLEDGNPDNYYDKAYKLQETYYWMPIPGWILRLRNIKSILDIGSAYGTLLLFAGLNHQVDSMVALDPVEYMSPSLKARYGIMTHKTDVERENISSLGKFDLLIFTEVIEHLNFHPLPTLLKIKELMNSESYLMLSTPDAEEWGRVTEYYNSIDEMPNFVDQEQEWFDGHVYQYTREELDALFASAGFKIERFSYAPGVYKRHLCYLLRLSH